MTSPADTVRQFVSAFIAAWPTGNATPLGRFFHEAAVYHNGPLEPVRDRDPIVASLQQMMGLGGQVDVDLLHLVAEGPIVMTERLDYWRSAGKTASLGVAGVFEIDDGLIAAWRDYFDVNEFTAQIGRLA